MRNRKRFTPFVWLVLCANLVACASQGFATPTVLLPDTPNAQAPTRTAAQAYASGFVEATPSVPVKLRGTFIYAAGDGSLWTQDAANGDAAPLIERSTESIAQMPAFSPDGAHIAYAAMLFLPDGNVRGDIRTADADGAGIETLVRAEANDVVYLYPRYAPDGRLLVTRAEYLQTTNERARLEWVVDGKPTRLMDDARDADISPDGTRIAFVRYDVRDATNALWTANADGTNPKALVLPGTFGAILNPRYSPDGQWIAFSVHGEPRKTVPLARMPVAQANACFLDFLLVCWVQTASAHMAPGALWRVNPASGKFQPLTDVYDDSPTPAWSNDGTQIAIHDFTGIRLIDVARQKIYPLFLQDGGTGGFDWMEK